MSIYGKLAEDALEGCARMVIFIAIIGFCLGVASILGVAYMLGFRL